MCKNGAYWGTKSGGTQQPTGSVTPLCVENNTIFTKMLENKRPLCREQYNIYIDA